MPVIRLNQLPVADAERVVADIWRVLEEFRIASPGLAVETHNGRSVELRVVFETIADAALVRQTLKRSAHWSAFLGEDPTGGARASAERYRLRAEECRTAADGMRYQQSRDTLRRIAEDYDLLADSMERAAEEIPGRKKPTG